MNAGGAAKLAEPSDAPGVRTPTDQRLRQELAAVQPATATLPAAFAVDRARLQELMDRFLRGEIDKAEYERLRAG